MSPIAQKTLFDLTQDGLVIGNKLKPLYPDFDVSAFVSDVRKEMQNQTIYNITNAIGKILRHHLPQNYHEALSILMEYGKIESPKTPCKNPTPDVELSLRPINEPFHFYFSFKNESEDDQTILTYYIICYKRLTGHITRKRFRFSQRKLKPKQQVDYEKSVFPLPSLKQYHDGKAGLGWHRLELEINGEVIDGFDFDVVAPTKR